MARRIFDCKVSGALVDWDIGGEGRMKTDDDTAGWCGFHGVG